MTAGGWEEGAAREQPQGRAGRARSSGSQLKPESSPEGRGDLGRFWTSVARGMGSATF